MRWTNLKIISEYLNQTLDFIFLIPSVKKTIQMISMLHTQDITCKSTSKSKKSLVVQFSQSIVDIYIFFHRVIMAERPEDLLVCRVCLEEYEGSGPHIPRILPCSHTVCEWCVIQLLGGGGTLKCPECRARHAAPRREKTFPQNKYLLTLIKLRDAESSGSEEESDEVRIVLYLCYWCVKPTSCGHS